LRKSGLTRLEQRSVLAAAGACWDEQKIEDALKLMYGDAHQDDRRRAHETGRGEASPSKPSWKKFQVKKSWGPPRGTHYEDGPDGDEATGGADALEEEQDDPEDEDEEDAEQDEEEDDEESEDLDADAEELMQAYYQGMKAKKQLRRMGVKGKGKGKGKGSGKRSSSSSRTDGKKSGTCRDCGGKGHWRGDPECPKVQSGVTPAFKKKQNGAFVVHAGNGAGTEPEWVHVPQPME
jgi:hypothetical protein